MKSLRFRREFDGAQDFDLVLRAVAQLMDEDGESLSERIVHIPRVLYHWRCHEGSTAENPGSKAYAYTAGKRAVEAFVSGRRDWKGITVEDTPHVGFYRLVYEEDIFVSRPDVGCVGGKVIAATKSNVPKGSILAGRYGYDGEVFYRGKPARYSGYMNRMAMQQDAAGVDLRCIRVRRECYALFEQIVGVPYTESPGEGIFDVRTLPVTADVKALSCKLGKALGKAGYRILWDPAMKRWI